MTSANIWTLTTLTSLNQDILEGRNAAGDLARGFQGDVLAGLLPSAEFSPHQAKQLLVLLGLAGASVGRHFQEQDPTYRKHPEKAFVGLTVGITETAFQQYFDGLADRTASGHGGRDSYASLVRWNVPTTEVRLTGERVAVLAGVFDDGDIRTYTGTSQERRFFTLLKMSETLELAVNSTLMPISTGAVDICADEAVERITRAVILLVALRQMNTDFAALPPQEGLRSDYFLDVFRQYAVHWRVGDVPPSGALDPEAMTRDLLLGGISAEHQDRIRHLFPGLLAGERSALTSLMGRPSLPQLIMGLPGLREADLMELSREQLMVEVRRRPVLAALYLLLNAHARLSGVHLMLSKKFLFSPQRHRERDGAGDPGVVSNRSGTTGMDESYLERLTRARHHHPLSMFRALPGQQLQDLVGLTRMRSEVPDDLRGLVGFSDDAVMVETALPMLWTLTPTSNPCVAPVGD
jgi:hypothetical protein